MQLRVSRELLNNKNITRTLEETPKVTARKLLRQIQEKKSDSCKQKAMHGYVHKMMKASTRNKDSGGCRANTQHQTLQHTHVRYKSKKWQRNT